MKTLVVHARDCSAVEQVRLGHWDSPWWFPGDTEYRRRNGYALGPREGGVRGFVLECNSFGCGGRAWVSEREILQAICGPIEGEE